MSLAAAATYRGAIGDVDRDAGELQRLWRGELGDDARMATKYQWFYRDAPGGPPLVALLHAEPGGRAVGACTVGRRRMLLDGKAVRGGIFVDFAVRAGHRTLGPALILQRGLLAAARDTFDLLYGFPNPKAAPVFLRTGYREIGRMVRHVHVLRHGHYLGRILPGWLAHALGAMADAVSRLAFAVRSRGAPGPRIEWLDAADDRVGRVWSGSGCPGGLVGVHDADFLRWRFDDSPLATAQYLLVGRRGARDPDAGFVVEAKESVLHVLDFWSRDGGPRLARWHVSALLSAARGMSGLSSVSVSMATSGPALDPWRVLGFHERDSRPVFATSTDTGQPMPEAFDFHLTAADEDE